MPGFWLFGANPLDFIPAKSDDTYRWALKEAAYKALYPNYRPTWKDLTYYPLGAIKLGSKPVLSFKYQQDLSFHCSVTHDGDYVFATVVVEK